MISPVFLSALTLWWIYKVQKCEKKETKWKYTFPCAVVVINVYPFSGVVRVRWSVPGLAHIWLVKVTKNGRLEEDGTAVEPLLRYAKSRFVYQSRPSPQNRSLPLRTVFGVWGYQNEIKNNNNSHNNLSRFRTRARLNEQLTMNRKTIWWRCPNTRWGCGLLNFEAYTIIPIYAPSASKMVCNWISRVK